MYNGKKTLEALFHVALKVIGHTVESYFCDIFLCYTFIVVISN